MDITFVGPIVGGLLALAGTSYLAFSANKRESIAAAERQLQSWYVVAEGEATAGGWPDIMRFASQGPSLWGDHEAWEIHNTVSRALMGEATLVGPAEFEDKFRKLRTLATSRILHLSKILEDLKRRSVWTFIRTEYAHKPGEYQFRTLMGDRPVEGDQMPPAASRLRQSPSMMYWGGVAVVAIGLVLIFISGALFALLGFALVALGVAGVVGAPWFMLGGIADRRLRKAARVLLALFVASYLLAVVNIPGGDFGKSFFIDLSAGSMTALIVLVATEYVRSGTL